MCMNRKGLSLTRGHMCRHLHTYIIRVLHMLDRGMHVEQSNARSCFSDSVFTLDGRCSYRRAHVEGSRRSNTAALFSVTLLPP